MDLIRRIIHLPGLFIKTPAAVNRFILINWLVISAILSSCNTDPYGSHWNDEDNLTVCQYLELNKEEYSKSYRLLSEAKMLTTLCGYNPHGEGYTLFLPTDEAVEQFIRQENDYNSFEDLLQDTSFIYSLMRYHTLKRKVHTDEFPFGALADSTLTGERLSAGFSAEGVNQIISINNTARVIRSNLDMTNGYIHTINAVLQKVEISGYDWLQLQENYSILAQALELSQVRKQMWWSRYTILAEHDSIYHAKGIYSIDDLIERIATPGMSLTNRSNGFYKFAGYHIVGGEYYLNDLKWGNNKYVTLDSERLTIDVGMDIQINPGIDIYRTIISESGDSTVVDYISPVWDNCNIVTGTGPVHSISEILFYEPFPE